MAVDVSKTTDAVVESRYDQVAEDYVVTLDVDQTYVYQSCWYKPYEHMAVRM